MALHPQAAAAVELWSQRLGVADPGFDDAAIRQRRREEREQAASEDREAVASVEDLEAVGVPVPVRVFRPEAAGSGAILYAHGGGFAFGDLDTHDAQSRRLANRTRLTVVAVDYRRPPEHVFPAAHDDTTVAARWLAAHAPDLGADPDRLVALGDSAGGSLALVAALREPGLFSALVLVYPFIDPTARGASFAAAADQGFSAAEADWYWRTYAGPDADRTALLADPAYCPLDASGLGDLPRTLVQLAEHDVLRDEGCLLATRIAASGGRVESIEYPGMIHGFWRHPTLFDAAETTYADLRAFLDR